MSSTNKLERFKTRTLPRLSSLLLTVHHGRCLIHTARCAARFVFQQGELGLGHQMSERGRRKYSDGSTADRIPRPTYK